MNSFPQPSAILVGDEIGQLKRIDLKRNQCNLIRLGSDDDNTPAELHPSKSIVSINPLRDDPSNRYFLISRKDHEIFIYDAQTNAVQPIKYIDDNKSPMVASQCMDDQNIIVGFLDGTIKRINVENDLCLAQYKPNPKAVNVLGIDASTSVPEEGSRKRRKIDQSAIQPSRTANQDISNEKQNILTIYDPKWNVDQTYLSCFRTNYDRLAIGGFNCDLKVFDLNTGQSVFQAKPVNTDWLGCRHDIWISGIDWIQDYNYATKESEGPPPSNMIATCSRTEPYVRIYDIKQRQRKPVMTINMKHLNNANNETNPFSFTTLCSLPSLINYNHASTSLIVGTTLGRMIALDLRIKSNTSKTLGVFKGFSGGSVRDIHYIRDSQTTHKIFSCSIDRFVRIHTMSKTTRLLDRKIYVKTRPTCLRPVLVDDDQSEDENEEEASTRDSEENEGSESCTSPDQDDDDEFF